jgi:GMP synthase-like glutamine amidotransferase
VRIACLQHVPFEGPGRIAEWATERGHSIETVRLYAGDPLPGVESFDLLLVMGGPMSVNDESEHAWLAPEKQLIRQCLSEGADGGRFVLGICLGSQLIASALGMPVYRNRVKEIGWFPVHLRPEASGSAYFSHLPETLNVFHWHGETYDLPLGCVHLASSEGCEIQAFEHPSALALQFHLEITEQGVSDLIRNCAGDIGSGPYEQPPEKLTAGEITGRLEAGASLYRMLDAVSAKVLSAIAVSLTP